MATAVIPQQASNVLIADTNPTPNTMPLRDNAAGVTHVKVTAAELYSSGAITGARALKSAGFTVDKSAFLFSCDATTAAFAATLPPAASVAGMIVSIKKIDAAAHNVTVTPNGAETIDGASSKVLSTQWQGVRLMSNGTNWEVLP